VITVGGFSADVHDPALFCSHIISLAPSSYVDDMIIISDDHQPL
jgi:hypothetical protein